MATILILVDCYLPSTNSEAKLIHDLAYELSNTHNHQVTLVTPDCNIKKPLEISESNQFTVFRVKTRKMKGVAKPLRAINELLLPYYLWKHGKHYFRSNPHELIIYYSPTIFWSPLIERLKALWQAKTYLILRDIFPQWAIDTGLLKNKLVIRFFQYFEKKLYGQADRIGVQSPNNLHYFSEKIWPKNYKLEVLYNWISLSSQTLNKTNYRQQLNLQNKVVFFYGGNIGVAQDMDNLLILSQKVKNHSHIHFLFVGDGSEYNRIKKQINQQQLNNVTLIPPVSQDKYFNMTAEFDIGLVTLDKKLKTQNIPGKLLPYMYHKKPVLASINPNNDLFDLITKHNIGLVSINGEREVLATQAITLATDINLRNHCGGNARKLLESTFSAAHAAKQIAGHAFNNYD